MKNSRVYFLFVISLVISLTVSGYLGYKLAQHEAALIQHGQILGQVVNFLNQATKQNGR